MYPRLNAGVASKLIVHTWTFHIWADLPEICHRYHRWYKDVLWFGWTRCIIHWTKWCDFNSLAPGKFEWHLRYLIFQIISVIDGWGIDCELALRRMSLDLNDDKSTLVQVMAWCRQATSHYLIQWWPRSLSPYGVTMPLWVNTLRPRQNGCHCVDAFSDSFSWMNSFLFLSKFHSSLFQRVQLTISQHWSR